MGRRKMDSDLHRIKLETGTVYQTSKGGNYYFRYQINGERKCVSLKTANQEEALRKAKALLPTVQATELEVIASHVKVARKLAAKVKTLPLSQVWEVYSQHPHNTETSGIFPAICFMKFLQSVNLYYDQKNLSALTLGNTLLTAATADFTPDGLPGR